MDVNMEDEFDFDFDCPVYGLRHTSGGWLTISGGLCLWTSEAKVTAALLRMTPPVTGFVVEAIATDAALIALLEPLYYDGLQQVILDLRPHDTFDVLNLLHG